MHKRLGLVAASFAVALGLLGLAGQPASAAVKTAFSNIQASSDFMYNSYTKVVAYHAKSTTKSAYIWNDTHTKKLYNLKSYPTYSWYQLATATKGQSKWVQVTNFPGTKRGWVWRGYLTKGYNTKGYQVTSKRYAQPTYAGGQYHVTSTTKNVYMWDWSHTKVRANLKNYANQSFGRRHSIRMLHNGTESWYYYVGVKTSKGYIYGYVAANNLVEGQTTYHKLTDTVLPYQFVSSADYMNYIKTNNYQKLTRAMVALFPNTPVDLNLTKITAYSSLLAERNFHEDDDDDVDDTNYTKLVSFPTVTKYLYDHRTASNATKIAAVKKLLAEQGYTQAKRNQLSDYKLGIYNINNIMVNQLNPNTKTAWYGLAIAKE